MVIKFFKYFLDQFFNNLETSRTNDFLQSFQVAILDVQNIEETSTDQNIVKNMVYL